MFLDTTTRKLQVILAGAKTSLDCPVTSDWVDLTSTTTTAGQTPSSTNGVTAVDIVAAPAASTQRKVNGLSLFNADTGAITATIRLNDNATLYPIVKVTLQIGDTLSYTDTGGWSVRDSNGSEKFGVAVGSISGLGTNVATFLATPSSANLAAALTDETGSGAAVFATSPTLVTPNIGAATATSLNGGPLAGLRNRIINGCCRIAQRVTGPTLSTAYQYGAADRMLVSIVGGSAISGTIDQNVAAAGFAYSCAAGTNSGSWTTGQFSFAHRIEGANTLDLNSRTITVLCKAYQNTGGSRNFKIALYKPTTTLDTFSATTLLQTSAAQAVPHGTATQLSASFALGATDASLGLQVVVYDDTANTVATKAYLVSDLELKIGTGNDLEVERLPLGLVLALCQRYYYRLAPGAANAPFGPAAVDTTTLFRAFIHFPVTMRVAPTALEQNGTATDYTIRSVNAATVCSAVPVFAVASADISEIGGTVAAGLTAGAAGVLRTSAGTTAGYLGWSAEL